MSNPLVDRIKLTHYKLLYKQGKFTERYIWNHGISNYVVFLVKHDFESFIKLTPMEQYEALISKQFEISEIKDYDDRAIIASNLFNNGYTNIFSEVNFLKDNNNPSKFWEDVLKRCERNETFYKTFVNLLDEETLLEEILKDHNFFAYLPPERQKEFVNLLDEETLLKEMLKDHNYFTYLPPERQKELIENNSEIRQNLLSGEEYLEFIVNHIKEDPFYFYKLNGEDKKKIISNKETIKLLPQELILEYIKSLNEEELEETRLGIVKEDINNVKFINLLKNDITYKSSEVSKIFKTMTDDEIVNFILHSKGKNMSAISHFFVPTLHHYSGGILGEIDYKFFQELSIQQISMLIKVDSNYILNYIDMNDFVKSKMKSIEVFKKLYGEDAFEKLSISFENLFEHCKQNPKGNQFDEYPLEELKILFNEKILKSCPPEMINAYYEKLLKNEDVSEDFRKIIQKTYGDRALAILESRPRLNVHSINSLEVFDERILDTFGEAFVHNCITYNMYDFQEFLEIVKNPERLSLFKNYYDILCKVYGENVETMQRCISEFSFNEELLKNIKDVNLTDIQSKNLCNVLAMGKNMLDINTIEDLDNFDKKVNERLKSIIIWYKNKVSTLNPHKYEDAQTKIKISDLLKNLLSNNLFGLRYELDKDNHFYYGDSIEMLLSLYDFENQEGYTDEEIKIMNILNFVKNEGDPDKIIEFIETNVKNNTFASRNMLELNELITKVAITEGEKLAGEITTIDKLEAQCELEKDKPIEERSIYMEVQDGIKVFHFEGYNPNMFFHNPEMGDNKMTLADISLYEGQAGNSTISTSLHSTIDNYFVKNYFIYGPTDAKSYATFCHYMANIDHTSKLIRMSGAVSYPISQPQKLLQSENSTREVAIYRYERDMSKISNENAGGRVYPIAIIPDRELTEQEKELCRKHNIAIIKINLKKYKKEESVAPEDETPVAKSGRTL